MHGQIRRLCLPEPQRWFQFMPPSDSEFDFCWQIGEFKFAVEVQGHPSHRNTRYEGDRVKQCEAALRGWTLIEVTPAMIADGRAIRYIRRIFQRYGTDLPPAKYAQDRRQDDKRGKTMPQAQKVSDIITSAGRHFLHLDNVEEDRIKSIYSKDTDGKSDVWYWHFTSSTKDENGTPERVRHMTDANCSPNNNHMKIVKQLSPGLTYEDYDANSERFEGKWYEAEIVHEQKNGKTYANIAFIKPYKKSAPAPPVEDVPGTAATTPAPAAPTPTPATARRPVQRPPIVTEPDEDDDPFSED